VLGERIVCEHGVDEVVPGALVAEVDLQAVREEGEEVGG
jgi:hypothetical protein